MSPGSMIPTISAEDLQLLRARLERADPAKDQPTAQACYPVGLIRRVIEALGRPHVCPKCDAEREQFSLTSHIHAVETRGDVRAEFARRAAGKEVL